MSYQSKVFKYIICAVYKTKSHTFVVNARNDAEALAKAKDVSPSAYARNIVKAIPA